MFIQNNPCLRCVRLCECDRAQPILRGQDHVHSYGGRSGGQPVLHPSSPFRQSVFLGMLHAYYDCRTKDKFQQWFGNLWIGLHPTPLQGRYQILHLDFSQVGGTLEKLEENFNFYLGMRQDGFINEYAEYYSEETKEKIKSTDYAGGKLALLLNNLCKFNSQQLRDACTSAVGHAHINCYASAQQLMRD